MIYKGTTQVKDARINILMCDDGFLEISSDEIVIEMYLRFTNIFNFLRNLGKKLDDVELVKKLLRSLIKSCNLKAIIIFELKDINTFPLIS